MTNDQLPMTNERQRGMTNDQCPMTHGREGAGKQTGGLAQGDVRPVDRAEQRWWYMVPSPLEHYATLLKICFCLASFQQSIPLVGKIPAKKGGCIIHLTFELPDADSFCIGWDPSCCGQHGGVAPNAVKQLVPYGS